MFVNIDRLIFMEEQ